MSVPEITAVLDRYAAAILAGDHAALDALLDTDYQFISAHARVVGRDRRLQTLAANAQALARVTFSDLDVRFAGSVAIVRAVFNVEFRVDTERADLDRGISTLVFRRHHDRWWLWHQHNSHSS